MLWLYLQNMDHTNVWMAKLLSFSAINATILIIIAVAGIESTNADQKPHNQELNVFPTKFINIWREKLFSIAVR